jgi:hypothetical protein
MNLLKVGAGTCFITAVFFSLIIIKEVMRDKTKSRSMFSLRSAALLSLPEFVIRKAWRLVCKFADYVSMSLPMLGVAISKAADNFYKRRGID